MFICWESCPDNNIWIAFLVVAFSFPGKRRGLGWNNAVTPPYTRRLNRYSLCRIDIFTAIELQCYAEKLII